MLEDFRLKVFVEVASQGSFTKAAAKLGVSQPAVSSNIAELEKALGKEVFTRDKSGIKLTTAGHAFMEYATRINHWYNAADNLFSTPHQGRFIRIKADFALTETILPNATAQIFGAHPDTIFEIASNDADIEISVTPRNNAMSLEEGSGFIGVLSATAITSSNSNIIEDLGIATWSGYRKLLAPDMYSAIKFQSPSVSSIIEFASRVPDVVGIIPSGIELPQTVRVLPMPLPHLNLDVNYKTNNRNPEIELLLKDSLTNILKR